MDFLHTQSLPNVELLTDFQLQIEHALDLQQRQLVLFIDASVANVNDIALQELQPTPDSSISTHALSPAALLNVYQRIMGAVPPDSFLMTLKAEQFELGTGLSIGMQQRLQQAYILLQQLFSAPNAEYWRQLIVH